MRVSRRLSPCPCCGFVTNGVFYPNHQADDELDQPYLAGFEWDKEESWTRLVVHLSKEAGSTVSSKKKKNKGGDE